MSSELPRWGRAGQRLTGTQARSRRVEHARRKQWQQRSRERDETEAYEQWQAGLLVPWRVTSALDFHGLEGPQVDRSCHAREPEVDEWEAGTRYPRWDQVRALAELTGFPLRFFFLEGEPIPLAATSLYCGVAEEDIPAERDPVLECDPDAVAVVVDPVQPGLF